MREHPGLVDTPIYLDYNATTPIDPRVVEVMLPALTSEFGNPSSAHAYAGAPRSALACARRQVAALIGAAGDDIVFTGSGSEADALAVRGAVLAASRHLRDRPHVVTQVTEHPAVVAACRYLAEYHDVEVTYLPVDAYGRVEPGDVEAALTPRTVIVSVMHANNETGTVQPIAGIAEVTRPRGVLLHTDAAQSVGKVDVDVDALDVDLLTLVGHKMHAPKGIAALYVRNGVRLEPLVGGGGQERGLRAGTESVALAVALGAAADLASAALRDGEACRLTGLRDLLVARLVAGLPGRVHLHGHPEERLPQTLNVRIDGAPARDLLAATPGMAASTGSACHAGDDQPSDGLRALGLTAEQAGCAIRLSLGRWTTEADVVEAAALLVRAASA